MSEKAHYVSHLTRLIQKNLSFIPPNTFVILEFCGTDVGAYFFD